MVEAERIELSSVSGENENFYRLIFPLIVVEFSAENGLTLPRLLIFSLDVKPDT